MFGLTTKRRSPEDWMSQGACFNCDEGRSVIMSPMFKIAADKKGDAIMKSISAYAEKNGIPSACINHAWKRYIRSLHHKYMAFGSNIGNKADKIAKRKSKPAAVAYSTAAILRHANKRDFIKTLNN